MANELGTNFGYASGINTMYIYQGNKELLELTEADWVKAAAFKEGTFNFTGDDITTTSIKTENGTVVVATSKDGTYGFEGESVDVGLPAAKFFLNMEEIVTTASAGWFKDSKLISYGKKMGVLEGIKIRLDFESGVYESIVYPNATLTSKLQGAGSTEDVVGLGMNCVASLYNDTSVENALYLLKERETV